MKKSKNMFEFNTMIVPQDQIFPLTTIVSHHLLFWVHGSYLESNKKSNNMATYNVTSKKCNAGNVCHQFLHYFEVLLCSGSPPRVIHWMGWNKNFALLPVLPSAAASAAERAKFFFGLVAMQLQFGWKRQRPRRKNVEVATPEKKHNFILKHFLLVSAI